MKEYRFEEEKFEKDEELTYSHYKIYHKDKKIFEFQVPEPFDSHHPVSTDAFLRYQHASGRATYKLYECLKNHFDDTPEITDASGLYYKSNDSLTAIFLTGTDLQVGAVTTGDTELNELMAKTFLSYFER